MDQIPLDTVAKLYGLSVSQLTPMSGGHFSSVYEFSRGTRSYVLRITPPDAGLDLASILEWLAFLAAFEAPVVRPVRSIQGNLIEAVNQANQTYLVGAFEKAPGMLAETIPLQNWTDELFQALGRTLGRCHAVTQNYVPASPVLKRPEWDSAANLFNPLEEWNGAESFILEKRKKLLGLIQTLPKDRESYGLAHLDLHFGNFFVDIEQRLITLFDFDDCAYGWYLMDIATLLFDILVVYDLPDKESFGTRFLENLLKGYLTQKPLSLFWLNQLPHFLKLLEIGVYIRLYRQYDPASADNWVGKFMLNRQERIEQDIPYIDLPFGVILEHLN